MTFRRKPWKREPHLVSKALGASAVDKGPVRSERHLSWVRQQPCLVCPPGTQTTPTRAHHPKGLFERTAGVRKDDRLCVPLCDRDHTDGPDALHRTGDELGWWKRRGADPFRFIRSSKDGRDALAAIADKERARLPIERPEGTPTSYPRNVP